MHLALKTHLFRLAKMTGTNKKNINLWECSRGTVLQGDAILTILVPSKIRTLVFNKIYLASVILQMNHLTYLLDEIPKNNLAAGLMIGLMTFKQKTIKDWRKILMRNVGTTMRALPPNE